MNTHAKKTTQTPQALGLMTALAMGLLFAFTPTQNAHAFSLNLKKHKSSRGHHNSHHYGHHDGLNIGIEGSHSRNYVAGHWAYRTENVLVAPARHEKVWIEPLFKDVVQEDDTTVYVKIHDGYYKEIYIPAQYETRIVKYYVPGYYTASPHNSGLNIGLGFHF